MTFDFWMTSLIVVLVPGTGVVFTISSGLQGGLRRSLWAAVGCTAGILPHIAASLVGLAALLNTCALAFSALKYLGVAYLLYVAWQMWLEGGALDLSRTTARQSGWSTLSRAFAMNILNPKLTIFFLAFLPQFVDPRRADASLEMVRLSACFMVLTLVVFVAYGVLSNAVRSLVLANPRILVVTNRSFAGLLAAFGVRLALTDR